MKILHVIGQGTYGKVYLAKDAMTGHVFAVKQFFNNPSRKCDELLHEYTLLRACKHPHILKCHDLLQTDTDGEACYLVLDYFPMDLCTFLRRRQIIRGGMLQHLARQMLEALIYLHTEQHIVHTDLKPGNFLFEPDSASVTLCDFASALRRWSPGHFKARGHQYGTLWYRAPENFLGPDEKTGLVFDTPLDMWALGCILFEMVAGRPLFPGRHDAEQFLHYCMFFGTPTRKTWPEIHRRQKWKQLQHMPTFVNRSVIQLKSALVPLAGTQFVDLLLRLLVMDPNQRLTAVEALQHPFFQQKITFRATGFEPVTSGLLKEEKTL